MKPYQDKHKNHNSFIRTFQENVSDSELEWHRDRKDRTVRVLESGGWKFQHDNRIPTEIKAGDTLHIRANQYHRILKGSGSLIVEIVEHEPINNTK